ncbi:hypothetical protein SKAU_G00018040 [Synaphobranchus kaupii]|uniref:Uncharacterized protein n=1 Tax=Synaphobranchus kaupii TaxID=118154 RepID=A0A9Q1JBX5_SYNKA|nr:hypothetical protein SKAU_G00018040 [Synaphobranchus kaupii]
MGYLAIVDNLLSHEGLQRHNLPGLVSVSLKEEGSWLLSPPVYSLAAINSTGQYAERAYGDVSTARVFFSDLSKDRKRSTQVRLGNLHRYKPAVCLTGKEDLVGSWPAVDQDVQHLRRAYVCHGGEKQSQRCLRRVKRARRKRSGAGCRCWKGRLVCAYFLAAARSTYRMRSSCFERGRPHRLRCAKEDVTGPHALLFTPGAERTPRGVHVLSPPPMLTDWSFYTSRSAPYCS